MRETTSKGCFLKLDCFPPRPREATFKEGGVNAVSNTPGSYSKKSYSKKLLPKRLNGSSDFLTSMWGSSKKTLRNPSSIRTWRFLGIGTGCRLCSTPEKPNLLDRTAGRARRGPHSEAGQTARHALLAPHALSGIRKGAPTPPTLEGALFRSSCWG